MRRLKRLVVQGLSLVCACVDVVVHHPVFLKLTSRLDWNWNCRLARLSIALDDRWKTGYWTEEPTPLFPGPPCEACHRRPSLVVVGGWANDDEDEPDIADTAGDFLATHEISLCLWCRPKWPPLTSEKDVREALREAGERSVSWRCRGA